MSEASFRRNSIAGDGLLRRHFLQQQHALQQHAERLYPRGDADADAVHQLRVATRKLRAALQAFGDLFPRTDKVLIKKQLRWLAKELSEMRDLNVYRQNLDRNLGALPPMEQAALD